MKINISIETDSPEEAAEIIAKISGKAPTPEKATTKKSTQPTVVKEDPPKEEPKAEKPKRSEDEVTAEAKKLVAASSPAVLRSVLDDIIGAGVKISGAPEDKYDAIFDAVAAKLAEINDV